MSTNHVRIADAWREGTRVVEVRDDSGRLVEVRRVCAECGN